MTFKLRKRTAGAAVAIAAAVAVTGVMSLGSAGAVPTVSGQVGPGFTITLKRNDKKVKRLSATTYKFRIKDRSSDHNFHLRGPGVNRTITTESFVGTKSVSIKLRKGTYRYVCDPHADEMKGSFKVG